MQSTARHYKIEPAADWSISKRDHDCDYTLRLYGHGICSIAAGERGAVKTKERAELLGRHWVETGIAGLTACGLSDNELRAAVLESELA